MSWKLEGTYFENCNCEMVCPCTTSSMTAPADYDRCQVLIALHIARGEIEGTDVSGLSAALVADAPPVMANGNWRAGLLIDAKANSEQRDKLTAVLTGQKGGPMAAAVPLIGEMLGVESAAIEYRDDGRRHSFRSNGTEVAIEDFVGGLVKEPQKLVGVAHPVTTTLTIARGAERSHVRAFGLDFDVAGKSAFSAPFTWSA
jgi:hypothetical protein